MNASSPTASAETTSGTGTSGTGTSGTGTSVAEAMAAAVDNAVAELSALVGVRAACAAVGRSRATHYRQHRVGRPPPGKPVAASRAQPRALSATERARVRQVLNSPRG